MESQKESLNKKNYTGQTFFQLTAISFAYKKAGVTFWLFKCSCGKEKILRIYDVLNGKTKSCGCFNSKTTTERNLKHGLAHRKQANETYNIWCHIKSRCLNKSSRNYKNYGGRGITMCNEWKNDFMAFYNDMGERPSKNHSIERIDNEKGYCKENCKWATRAEQNRNTRQNVWLEYNGEKLVLTDWAAKIGIKRRSLGNRIARGWSVEKALTTPLRKW